MEPANSQQAWDADHVGFHVGQTFGDYSITALLGAGSMGRVYKVEHCLTKRTEAMKVLSAELASEIQIKRFEREMRALARLSHPNIAALHNAVHSENQLILLMEYVEGQTLESMFGTGRLPLDQGVGYVREILLALGYAHQKGVVHRDVTPANVLVTAGGHIKLSDFGLSKSYGDPLLTNCGEILGSLPYLAPERLKGTTQPDRRSDLYSAGAILYEHLTGQKPFGENRRLAPVLTDSESEPRPPSQVEPGLSPNWDEILRRALARDPVHRYQSAEEFLEAINQLERPTGVADLPLPQLRTLGIGVAIFGGLVLAFGLGAFNSSREVRPPAVPWQRLHIAPPAFAADKTPPVKEALIAPPARVSQRAEIRHAKGAAPAVDIPAKLSVFEPHPAVLASPQPLAVPVARPAPAPSAFSVATVPLASDAAKEASEPPPSHGPEPVVQPDAKPKKRGFWNKLNVFRKRKKIDSDETQ
jgi:serine/threonine-protein kinase